MTVFKNHILRDPVLSRFLTDAKPFWVEIWFWDNLLNFFIFRYGIVTQDRKF